MLRGSRDFDTLDAYPRLVDEFVGRRNARNRRRLDLERPTLQPLPAYRTTDYEEATAGPRGPRAGLLRDFCSPAGLAFQLDVQQCLGLRL